MRRRNRGKSTHGQSFRVPQERRWQSLTTIYTTNLLPKSADTSQCHLKVKFLGIRNTSLRKKDDKHIMRQSEDGEKIILLKQNNNQKKDMIKTELKEYKIQKNGMQKTKNAIIQITNYG